MKKPAAPLTREDGAILARIRVTWNYPLNHWYQYYDRCDGELMFRAQSNRYSAVPPDWPDTLYAEDPPMLRAMVFPCGPVGGDITKLA